MSPAGRFVVPIIHASAKGQAVCDVVLRAHISGRGDAALPLLLLFQILGCKYTALVHYSHLPRTV